MKISMIYASSPYSTCASSYKLYNIQAVSASHGGWRYHASEVSAHHTSPPTIVPMKAKFSATGLVYSTDSGRMCPNCRQTVAACQCSTARPQPATDGIVRVSRETKGRAGKGVTLVRGLALDDAGLQALGKQLKTACGSGGTVKDGVIEVQGDHCARVLELLKAQGLTVKRAGG